jgi:hypothetical protein
MRRIASGRHCGRNRQSGQRPQEVAMDRRAFMTALAVGLAPLASPAFAARRADAPPRPGERDTFSSGELLESGHSFFGNVSRGLALTLEEAVRRWGEPSGYILGQQGSGAFFGGLSYGEGVLYARRGRGTRIYWQGRASGSTSAARARAA